MDEYNDMTIQEVLNLDGIGKLINTMIENDIYRTSAFFGFNKPKKIYIELGKNFSTNNICSICISLVNTDSRDDQIIIEKKSTFLKDGVRKINPGDFNLSDDDSNLFTIRYIDHRGLEEKYYSIVSNDFTVYNAKYGLLISKDCFTDLKEECSFKIVSDKHLKPISNEKYKDSIYYNLHDYGDISNRGVDDEAYDKIMKSYWMIDLPVRLIDICKNMAFSKEEIEYLMDELQDNKDSFVKVYR